MKLFLGACKAFELILTISLEVAAFNAGIWSIFIHINSFFVNAHLEAAAEFILTKQKRKYRVPWETLAVRKKRADVKAASKCNRKNPTNTNVLKLKKAQNELANIYLKEQTEYIQN